MKTLRREFDSIDSAYEYAEKLGHYYDCSPKYHLNPTPLLIDGKWHLEVQVVNPKIRKPSIITQFIVKAINSFRKCA